METFGEQGYTMCISAQGIEFGFHVKGFKSPLLWARTACKLSAVGLHFGLCCTWCCVCTRFQALYKVNFGTVAPVQRVQ